MWFDDLHFLKTSSEVRCVFFLPLLAFQYDLFFQKKNRPETTPAENIPESCLHFKLFFSETTLRTKRPIILLCFLYANRILQTGSWKTTILVLSFGDGIIQPGGVFIPVTAWRRMRGHTEETGEGCATPTHPFGDNQHMPAVMSWPMQEDRALVTNWLLKSFVLICCYNDKWISIQISGEIFKLCP